MVSRRVPMATHPRLRRRGRAQTMGCRLRLPRRVRRQRRRRRVGLACPPRSCNTFNSSSNRCRRSSSPTGGAGPRTGGEVIVCFGDESPSSNVPFQPEVVVLVVCVCARAPCRRCRRVVGPVCGCSLIPPVRNCAAVWLPVPVKVPSLRWLPQGRRRRALVQAAYRSGTELPLYFSECVLAYMCVCMYEFMCACFLLQSQPFCAHAVCCFGGGR